MTSVRSMALLPVLVPITIPVLLVRSVLRSLQAVL